MVPDVSQARLIMLVLAFCPSCGVADVGTGDREEVSTRTRAGDLDAACAALPPASPAYWRDRLKVPPGMAFIVEEPDNTSSAMCAKALQPELSAVNALSALVVRGVGERKTIDACGRLPAWEYIYDPDGHDIFQSAAYTLSTRFDLEGWVAAGDCEDYSMYVASMLRARGYRAFVGYLSPNGTPSEGHNTVVVMDDGDIAGNRATIRSSWTVDWDYEESSLRNLERRYGMSLYKLLDDKGEYWLIDLLIVPATATMAVGAQVLFAGDVVGSQSCVGLDDGPVASKVVWHSSAPEICEVSNAPETRGLVTGLQAGTCQIHATIGTLASSPTTVTVIAD